MLKRRKKVRKKVEWISAPDIDIRLRELIEKLDLNYIKADAVHAFRSTGTKTRAYARIWGLSRIFQLALGINPNYVIEVISEKFDKLKDSQKDEILIHELVHIPKSFSGSLAPHRRGRKGRLGFEDRVHELYAKYKRIK